MSTSKGAHTPPRLVTRILRRLLGEGPAARSIMGDLHEEYHAIADDRGPARAAVWYWRQALGTGLSYARPGRASLDRMRQDLAFAVRGLLREPGFATAVIATLALAIGAGTAIFSVVDGVLLRPLPFDAPHELVRVWASNERTREPYVDLMYSDIEPFRSAVSSFASVSGLSVAPRVMMDERGENRENILVGRSTSDLFQTLGVEPLLGRLYTTDDARTGERLVVISHELWQRRFAGASDVIGRFVHLDVRGFEIIGVLPPRMGYPEGVHVWRALMSEEMEDDDREVHLVARLDEGARPSAAQAEVASVAAALAYATPETHVDLSAWLQPLQAMVVRDVEAALWALLGAVGVLLLIACLNTANLLLARAARSSHEVAIRTALGASRVRIVAMRLTESLLLAVLGGIAGIALGRWVLSLLLGVGPELPRVDEVGLDLRVVGVMTAVTALAGILFGVAPALHAASTPPERTLREETPGASRGGRRLRLQSALVATELALSTVLAVAAALLFSTFRTAVTYDRGFEFDNLVAITVDPMHPPEGDDATRAYFASILERVRRLGGVREAALSSHPILEPRGFRVPVAVEGAPVVTPTPTAYVNIVSHGWFATAGIALVEGSGFSLKGGVEGDAELVVNERFAELHLVDADRSLGARVSLDWIAGHVVGVADDVQTELDEPALPKVYVSLERVTVPGMSVTVRTITDPAAIVPAVRAEVEAVDQNVLLEEVTVVSESVQASAAPQRFNMLLVSSFAVLALTLAAVGIYGVTAYSVAARRREIGVRRALGASNKRVALEVGRRIGWLVLLGVTVGLFGAASSGPLLSSLLVGVSPTDPRVLGGVALLSAAAAAAATLGPTVRALRVDLTESLRSE